MRIALVSTCATSTPPAGYGGTELVVAELAKGLVSRGHDVVTFGTGDSSPNGRLKWLFETPVWPPDESAEERHARFASREIAAGVFDVVQVNHAASIRHVSADDLPCVATIHHDRVDRLVAHYAAFPKVAYVAISRRQADLSPEIHFERVIHHGLDASLYPAGTGEGGYAAHLGRFTAAKGTHVALDVAVTAGVPIHLGGTAHEVDDALRYFASELRPRFDRMGARAVWHGEVGHDSKLGLLRAAKALLFPIDWEEPFGLVMIEAMLVGTPVLAFKRGSVPEVVEDGVTGFLVDDAAEMTRRLRDIDGFDRAKCRARALDRWSTDRMARDYEALFEELVERRRQARRAQSAGGGVDHGATATTR